MSLEQMFSWFALALTIAVVGWWGRRPERVGIAVIAIGWLLTLLLLRKDSWYSPQYGVMVVDGALLAVFILMAFAYDRYWIICIAAFQAVAFLTHFIFLIDPHAFYRAYYFANFAIGYLILGAMIGGVIIERAAPARRRWRPRRSQRGLST